MELYDFMMNAPDIIKEAFIHQRKKKNETVIFQESENIYLYILVKGSVDVVMQNYNGAKVVLYNNDAYSLFGELEIFNENIKSHAVICRTDCELFAIHKDNVFKWMQMDFDFTMYIINQLTRKLVHSSKAMYNLSLMSVKDRLINCIYIHDRHNGLKKLTKEMVCNEIFAPIRSVNRAIAQCQKEGLFEYRDKKFVIYSFDKINTHIKSL